MEKLEQKLQSEIEKDDDFFSNYSELFDLLSSKGRVKGQEDNKEKTKDEKQDSGGRRKDMWDSL